MVFYELIYYIQFNVLLFQFKFLLSAVGTSVSYSQVASLPAYLFLLFSASLLPSLLPSSLPFVLVFLPFVSKHSLSSFLVPDTLGKEIDTAKKKDRDHYDEGL